MTPSSLTVFSLNLRFGLADDGPNRWHYRRQLIPRLLNRYPADFYSFQEVNDFQARDIQAVLTNYRFIGKRQPAPSYWQNNIIFYHPAWRCTEHHHFYLSLTPDVPSKFDDSRWPRQCTMGVFQQADRRLVCINTHFDFKETVQERSARLIISRLSTLPITEPAIMVGDFNATPDDGCYQILTGTTPQTQPAGYDKSGMPFFEDVFEQPFPSTHHGFTGQTEGDHIDWVLYRGKIEPKERMVIHDVFNGRYPSDHFPLFVRFQWRQ